MPPHKQPEGKPVTVRDLARILGISIGTVDRALHQRPEVSEATKKRVLQAAKRLGYRPNQTARYLATGRKLKIAVSLPRELAAYYKQVRQGVTDEASILGLSGLSVAFQPFPRLGEGEEESLRRAIDSGADGILIAPGMPQRLKPLIRDARSSGIPVLCVSTDAPGTERLSAVSIDPESSGALAAELLGNFVGGQGHIALVTGDLSIADHAEKVRSYQRTSQISFPRLKLLPTIEGHEDEVETYGKMRDQIGACPDLSGVYISTVNALPVLRALRDTKLLGKIKVISTDLFPALVPLIKSADVIATIYQRPRTQGQIALRTMWRFLAEGEKPPDLIRLAPHLVMRGNLPFFLAQKPFASRTKPAASDEEL